MRKNAKHSESKIAKFINQLLTMTVLDVMVTKHKQGNIMLEERVE